MSSPWLSREVQRGLGDASEPKSGTPPSLQADEERGPPDWHPCFHLMALLGQSSKLTLHLFRSSLLTPGPKTLKRACSFLAQFLDTFPMAPPQIRPLETGQGKVRVGS